MTIINAVGGGNPQADYLLPFVEGVTGYRTTGARKLSSNYDTGATCIGIGCAGGRYSVSDTVYLRIFGSDGSATRIAVPTTVKSLKVEALMHSPSASLIIAGYHDGYYSYIARWNLADGTISATRTTPDGDFKRLLGWFDEHSFLTENGIYTYDEGYENVEKTGDLVSPPDAFSYSSVLEGRASIGGGKVLLYSSNTSSFYIVDSSGNITQPNSVFTIWSDLVDTVYTVTNTATYRNGVLWSSYDAIGSRKYFPFVTSEGVLLTVNGENLGVLIDSSGKRTRTTPVMDIGWIGSSIGTIYPSLIFPYQGTDEGEIGYAGAFRYNESWLEVPLLKPSETGYAFIEGSAIVFDNL